MYTTKRYHHHGSQKFVSIGDPYEKRLAADSRSRGRQFQTRATPTHRFSDYFSRATHPKGERYTDKQSYLQQQPRDRRKLGFGSGDANKKGEFTLTSRTLQWKERLDRERRLERKAEVKAAKVSSEPTPKPKNASQRKSAKVDKKKRREFFQCRVPRLLYDIGRTKSGTTPNCSRCARDTFFCRHRAKSSTRDNRGVRESDVIGPQLCISESSSGKSTTHNSNDAPSAFADVVPRKPEFGRRSAVSQFYSHNHLHCG